MQTELFWIGESCSVSPSWVRDCICVTCEFAITSRCNRWDVSWSAILHHTLFFEQTELAAKLLDYFLWSNKSNINQESAILHHTSVWLCNKNSLPLLWVSDSICTSIHMIVCACVRACVCACVCVCVCIPSAHLFCLQECEVVFDLEDDLPEDRSVLKEIYLVKELFAHLRAVSRFVNWFSVMILLLLRSSAPLLLSTLC